MITHSSTRHLYYSPPMLPSPPPHVPPPVTPRPPPPPPLPPRPPFPQVGAVGASSNQNRAATVIRVFVDGSFNAGGRFVGNDFTWMNNTFMFAFGPMETLPYSSSSPRVMLVDDLSVHTTSGRKLYETKFDDTSEFFGASNCYGDGTFIKDGTMRFPSDRNKVQSERPTTWQTSHGLNISFNIKTFMGNTQGGFSLGLTNGPRHTLKVALASVLITEKVRQG